MIDKVMDVVVVSSENVGSSVAGSVTESIMHPREARSFVAHLTKALFVGWALAVFVSPAITDRFQLTKNESTAICFIGGYFGIRIVAAAEKIASSRLNKETKD